MLKSVAIGIKTFLRDDHLMGCIAGIQRNLPECQMIIADCGYMTEEKDGVYSDLRREGHAIIDLPFDAGFGAMSNAIVNALERPYILIGSDDFDFAPLEVKFGIEKLVDVLASCPEVDIASGRVNHNPYEFFLEESNGEYKEVNIHLTHEAVVSRAMTDYWFTYCDLTANYSLIRKKVFDKVRWDEDVKIGGGEHGSWFIDAKKAGFKTVFVPGVNINEQKVRNPGPYKEMRNRARGPERRCFVKRGVKKYTLANGQVDYKETI